MTRRDDVIDAIWDALARHEPREIAEFKNGTWIRCDCQPADAGLMYVSEWRRHVAEHAADAASKLNDR